MTTIKAFTLDEQIEWMERSAKNMPLGAEWHIAASLKRLRELEQSGDFNEGHAPKKGLVTQRYRVEFQEQDPDQRNWFYRPEQLAGDLAAATAIFDHNSKREPQHTWRIVEVEVRETVVKHQKASEQ